VTAESWTTVEHIANTEQAAAWNGAEGLHWAEHQEDYDAVNSPFDEPLLTSAAIAGGDRVLDVGCGNGQLTRLAARLAGSGGAVGVDLSEPMLHRARESAVREGVANVEFVRGDAQVHPFPSASFDVAVSRFGVMFFGDPVAAFANVRRALRPGGRLAFLSLQPAERNEVATVMAGAARRCGLSGEPAARAGAYALSDPEQVRTVLDRAGFHGARVAGVEAAQRWGRDAGEAARFLAGWGPVRALLADAASADAAREALVAEFRAHEDPDGVRLRGAAWLVTATA